VQIVGKVPFNVNELNVHMASLSAHKMYGPKGVGALYVRRRPRVRLESLFDGGAQERGIRSGTLAAPLCVALGAACEIAGAEMAAEAARLWQLRDRLYRGLTKALPELVLNGDAEHRLPGNLNIGLPGIDGQALLAEVPELSLSLGSACTSAAVEPSYVLKALGLPDELANGSIRIGLGRFTSEAEVDFAVDRLASAASRLRSVAPSA